ncbi:MAG: hypothetical protein KAI53_02240 [Candidatus Aenigmarchaeota archaeon]|nr:hypothetical protein [Candidatus Aenigmarchaeota archaeon]
MLSGTVQATTVTDFAVLSEFPDTIIGGNTATAEFRVRYLQQSLSLFTLNITTQNNFTGNASEFLDKKILFNGVELPGCEERTEANKFIKECLVLLDTGVYIVTAVITPVPNIQPDAFNYSFDAKAIQSTQSSSSNNYWTPTAVVSSDPENETNKTDDGEYFENTTGNGFEETCTEEWVCSAWGECINDTQTRTCVDANNCETDEIKPFELQQCFVLNKTVKTVTESYQPVSPTGFVSFVNLDEPKNLVLVGLVVCSILILIFWMKKSGKKH